VIPRLRSAEKDCSLHGDLRHPRRVVWLANGSSALARCGSDTHYSSFALYSWRVFGVVFGRLGSE